MKNHTFESLDKNKLQRMLEIKQLYTDGSLTQQEAKKRMQNEVGSISPEEFAAAEQLLKDEDPDECRKEDVRSMLDLFDGLIPATEVELPYGHPIDAYLRENIKMKELLHQGGELLQKPFIINAWSELMEISCSINDTSVASKINFIRHWSARDSTARLPPCGCMMIIYATR